MENQTRFYGYGYQIIDDWTLVTGGFMMMVVPEAWEKHQTMSDDKKSILSIMLVSWNWDGLPLFRLLMEM
jgi:hypothetical protein